MNKPHQIELGEPTGVGISMCPCCGELTVTVEMGDNRFLLGVTHGEALRLTIALMKLCQAYHEKTLSGAACCETKH